MYGIVFGICGLLVFANPRIVSKTWSGIKSVSHSSYSLSYDFLKDILVPQLKNTSSEVVQETKVAREKLLLLQKKQLLLFLKLLNLLIKPLKNRQRTLLMK